jgi:hypothetical protein
MQHLLSSLYFTVVFLYMFREHFTSTHYHILRLVPVVVHAVFRTPDDGRKVLPKHVGEYYSEI